ncbi:PREDICTED: 28 kDa heat- and acid-stable phosphoprotein [Crocodylus porosus]|uniref:PDGFA associated protein 1 n=2 Tax=Crocodylia TaxID=1294634 RepID=A0A7M4FCL0_CROPO|nr:PREDICTED: 28 kDa heat- and acid-stable phosphoprotein [Crocodylus porosus]
MTSLAGVLPLRSRFNDSRLLCGSLCLPLGGGCNAWDKTSRTLRAGSQLEVGWTEASPLALWGGARAGGIKWSGIAADSPALRGLARARAARCSPGLGGFRFRVEVLGALAAAAAGAAITVAMPKGGRKGGHKGRARQYTSPEEIDAQLQAEKQKAREEEEQEEGGEGATGEPRKEKKSLDSDESEEDDEDYQQKRKGVEGLIDIENPNRVLQTTKKVTQLDLDGPKELSRREREEIEKQKAKERYMKMHLAGKTEQAKADLARLAIIRKQREEAARKKEEERKAKDEATTAGKRMQSLSLNK